jgi:phosphocarrier protein HPr
MATISGIVTIEDPIGFHARPAGQIVKLVKDSGLEIRMGRVGESLVKANSPLSLMSLKGKTSKLTLTMSRRLKRLLIRFSNS